jgi:SAM-dependent methyltransferase
MTPLDQDRFRYLRTRQDDRQDAEIGDFRGFIRRAIDKAQPAIEVGPSHAPIIAKRDGYAVKVIDHLSREELAEKYRNDVPDVSLIEDVDVVWGGEDLSDLLPHDHFAAIVASHFIEHAPDMLGFLKQCEQILTPDGTVYFCVPDRRYCFDAFHAATSTGKVIEDHRLKRKRHSFESFYNVSSQLRADGEIAWAQSPLNQIEFITGMPSDWLNSVDGFLGSETYVDNHENYFSPSSFALMIEELNHLGLLRLQVELVSRARGSEFLAVLSKRPQRPEQSLVEFEKLRVGLRLSMLREDAEQIEAFKPLFAQYGL